MSSFRTRRRPPKGGRSRKFAPFSASIAASIVVLTITVLMLGNEIVGNAAALAQTRATPTPIDLNRDFRPIDIATKTPASDGPALGVPTETPVTEEVIPTDEAPPVEPTEVAIEEGRHSAEPVNSLLIWKMICPAGTARDLTEPDYADQCTKAGRQIEFTFTSDAGDKTGITIDDGRVGWSGFTTDTTGELRVRETVPDTFGEPVVFCQDTSNDLLVAPSEVIHPDVIDGGIVLPTDATPYDYTCWWYNIPTGEPNDGNAIQLWKHYCPLGTSPTLTIADYMAVCTEPKLPTTFTLTDPQGDTQKTTDANGYTRWLNVDTSSGQITIFEHLLPGYGTPQVFCEYSGQQPEQVDATNGQFLITPFTDEFRMLCQVFNIPADETPASLTIVKYTCPEGYDLYAPGANPGFDCQTLTDGIPFVLDDGKPGIDLGGTTGDNGPGTLSFADVEPGNYTVEEIVPPGTGSSFVLKCEGDVPQLQPYPLWSGNDLPITLTPGNAVWCFWYNVPLGDPDEGTLTVTKYACTTEVFVSTVDCQVYEGGQVMDLLEWDGVQWDKLDTEQTDANGRIVWTHLPIGHYLLAEQGTTWCHIESSALLGNDGSFNINQQGGMDQTVDLYNCGFDPTIPEGTPTDWPNTGVGVGQSDSGTRLASREERNIPPVEGGDPATPVVNHCLALADPAAVTGDATCPRGAVPATIRIDAIGVEAPIEVKETVGGQMEQPTGETAVAWYKESPRLGETGNMLFAGHLNWWGIPEAVFFRLGDLQHGDTIVVTDASGAEWTYRVSWVRQDETALPPSADVLGPTDEASITLITCGGEWNAETGLYDKRTVVRAVLVSGPEME